VSWRFGGLDENKGASSLCATHVGVVEFSFCRPSEDGMTLMFTSVHALPRIFTRQKLEWKTVLCIHSIHRIDCQAT
jgi:hypothetical protein